MGSNGVIMVYWFDQFFLLSQKKICNFLCPLCSQDQNEIAETIVPMANNNKNKLNFAESDYGSGDINQNKKASR